MVKAIVVGYVLFLLLPSAAAAQGSPGAAVGSQAAGGFSVVDANNRKVGTMLETYKVAVTIDGQLYVALVGPAGFPDTVATYYYLDERCEGDVYVDMVPPFSLFFKQLWTHGSRGYYLAGPSIQPPPPVEPPPGEDEVWQGYSIREGTMDSPCVPQFAPPYRDARFHPLKPLSLAGFTPPFRLR